MEFAKLVATIEADIRPLEAGLKSATATINEVPKAAQAASASAAQSFKRAEDSALSFNAGLGKALGTMTLAGAGFAVGMKAVDLVGKAMAFAGESAIGLNGRLEMATIGFTSMLGSAEAAGAYLRQLQTLANETPFEFPELVDAAKRFLNMGVSAQQSIPMLQGVADAVARLGGGAAEIDQVSRALLQINTKGKVSAEEMNQLAEAGINGWKILSDTMGITSAEATKLAEKGQISAAQWNKSFLEFTKANYGGEAKKQSATFQGAMSTIVDAAGLAIAKGAKPLFDRISAGAQTIAQFVQSATFEAWATRTSAAMESALKDIEGLVGGIAAAGKAIQEFSASSGVKGGIEGFIGGLNEVENVVRRGLGLAEIPRMTQAVGGSFATMADQGKKDAETIANANVTAAKVAEDAWVAFGKKDLLTEALSFRETFKDPAEAVKEGAKTLADAEKALRETTRNLGQVTADAAAKAADAHKAAGDQLAKAYADTQAKLAKVAADATAKTVQAEADAAEQLSTAVRDSGERVAGMRVKASQVIIAAGNAANAAIDKALDAANAALAQAAADRAERMAAIEQDAAEKIAAAVADHREKVSDAQAKAAEQMATAARDAAKTIAEAHAAAAEKVADAAAEFTRKSADAAAAANEKHAQIAAERGEALAAAEAKYGQAVAAAVQDASDKILGVQQAAARTIADALDSLALERATRVRRDALDETLDAAARARSTLREDAEAQYQYERDLARATSEDERARITERFRAAQEDSAHRRQLAEEDRLFAAQQAAQRRALDDQLADEALKRTIARATAERDARVAAITDELGKRRAALAAGYAEDVAAANDAAAKKNAAVDAGVAKERATLQAWYAERLAAIRDAEAQAVDAAREKQTEREAAIKAGLARELADLDEALGKRRRAVEDQLAKELAAEAKAATDKNAAVAAKRAEDIRNAQAAYAERKRTAEQSLADEVLAEQTALNKRALAIADHLEKQRSAISLDAQGRVVELNAAYAEDVRNAGKALAEKLQKIGDEADAERRKLVASYAERVRDMREEFLAKLPKGADIGADNFIDALAGKLRELKRQAEDAGTAISGIPPMRQPAYPGDTGSAPLPVVPVGPSLSGSPHPQPGETVVAGPDGQGRYAYRRAYMGGTVTEWRDMGGPGYPGHAYGIGVPEVYVPDRPGTFVPLGGAGVGGGGAGPIHLHVDLDGREIARATYEPDERRRRRGVR